MKKITIGLAAASVALTPVAASAVEASVQPATAPVTEENEFGGESGILIALLAAAAVIAGIIIIADDDDAVSP